jgi:Amt family ammonium transporter
VGWFGFNAGSALAADGRAGLALLVTHIAAAAGALSWMGVEWLARKRVSLLGLCSGVVAGLVAITPAAGFVTPRSALLMGLVAGAVWYWGATALKRKLQADDSLDVFGVHGVGGLVGALLTGLLADPAIAGVEGSVVTQLIACVAVLGYSLIMTALVLWITSRVTDLRVSEEDERTGLDLALHKEQIPH